METETFTPWEPGDWIPKRIEVDSIRDDDEGLCLVLANEGTREVLAKLVFQDFIAYRNINESFRTRTWRSHRMAGLSSLLIVERSRWLNWLREESGGILDEAGLTHYAIYTSDDCIDVAAKAVPLVMRITRSG